MTYWKSWLGIELSEVSYQEKLISALGGCIALLLLTVISAKALHFSGAAAVIASMGASAVLLFAVPHGQLSQPWPVAAGHVIPAFLGVCCAKWIPQTELAAACAVGLAIASMHQLKCIHPPGGATALTAVLGGPAVHELGFKFVLFPVLLNALVMITLAVTFNCCFNWRRYPAFLNRLKSPPPPSTDGQPLPTHEEIVEALRRLDSFVDITEADLVRLTQILQQHIKPNDPSRPAATPQTPERQTSPECENSRP